LIANSNDCGVLDGRSRYLRTPVLVAADVGEALDLPRHHGGEVPTRCAGAPVIERDRLPRLVPDEITRWHGRPGRANVGAESEEVIEAAEELDVPRLGLRDGQLRERRVGVDEHLSWNPRVFVAPEPRSARQIDEQIGVGGVAPHIIRCAAVIRAVVVHERPALAKPERRKRVVDVRRAVAGIGRAGIFDRVVHALARVLDVEDFVPERAQAKQVHQGAPRDAAERIPGNDAREEDTHDQRRAA
jgi:hypothetical protein